jgi:putative flippase GtrA
MKPPVRHEAARVARFLLLGASNSLASIALYAALERTMPIPVAYGLGYLAGIASSAVLSGSIVFRAASTPQTRLRAGVGYTTVLGLGLLIVWLLQSGLRLPAVAAGVASLLVTAPTNYLLGRYLFVRGATPTGPRL